MNLLLYFSITTVLLVLITGIYSLIATKYLVKMVISLEIMMKSVTLLIIAVGYVTKRPELAQSMVITMIIIEAVTAAVAVGIAVGLFHSYNTLDITKIRRLKGKEE
jgi:NADH:ubiquinone oxidoreductase subunit K